MPASQVRAAAAIGTGVPMIRVDTGAAASRVEAITQVAVGTGQQVLAEPDRDHRPVERTPDLAVVEPASASGGGAGSPSSTPPVSWSRRYGCKPAGMPAFGPAAALAALRGSPSVAAAVTVLHEVPAPIARLVTTVTASSPQNVTLGLSNGVTVVWGSTARAAAKTTELYALMRVGARYYDVSAPGTAVNR